MPKNKTEGDFSNSVDLKSERKSRVLVFEKVKNRYIFRFPYSPMGLHFDLASNRTTISSQRNTVAAVCAPLLLKSIEEIPCAKLAMYIYVFGGRRTNIIVVCEIIMNAVKLDASEN